MKIAAVLFRDHSIAFALCRLEGLPFEIALNCINAVAGRIDGCTEAVAASAKSARSVLDLIIFAQRNSRCVLGTPLAVSMRRTAAEFRQCRQFRRCRRLDALRCVHPRE